MERRRFLNLVSFGAVGVAAPTAVYANKTRITSDPKKDGPVCEESLSLMSGTKPKPKPVDNNKFSVLQYNNDKYEEHKKVDLAVGKDGNLWIRSEKDDWKRIVTE